MIACYSEEGFAEKNDDRRAKAPKIAQGARELESSLIIRGKTPIKSFFEGHSYCFLYESIRHTHIVIVLTLQPYIPTISILTENQPRIANGKSLLPKHEHWAIWAF